MGMSTTTATVASGVTVTLGRWSEGQGMSFRVVVGCFFLIFMLAMLSEMAPKLAQSFGVLILIGVVFRYARSIIDAAGFASAT